MHQHAKAALKTARSQPNPVHEQIKMRLHPQNPTPGVNDLPPAPPKEPVTTKDLLDLIAQVLLGMPSGGDSNKAWDKLHKLRARL
jgi:hypothetical protein